MPALKARTALACRIVRLDRQKFNDAVRDGHYACAPETQRGSSRIFSELDMLGLYVFARLSDIAMLPREAGHFACEFMREARNNPNEDRIVFLKGMSGGTTFLPGSGFDPDIAKQGKRYGGVGDLSYTLDFHVGHIRSLIREALEAEYSVLGEEDGE